MQLLTVLQYNIMKTDCHLPLQGSIPINGGSQGSHASLEEQMMQNSQLRLARIRSEGSQGDQRQRKAYRSSDGTFFDTRSYVPLDLQHTSCLAQAIPSRDTHIAQWAC